MRSKLASATVVSFTIAAVAVTGSPPATAAAITLPDMRIQVPTSLISIGLDPTNGHKQLRFTHRTENAGTGPFEIDPTYDSTTGIATFTQAVYSSPSPGVWQLDHSVPVPQIGTRVPPDDYSFPLTRFTLNEVNGDGSLGAVVATSPKTDYCITGDYRVGDVPNTPAQSSPPQSNCGDPTKPLGWSVGWADQYDQTDAGQPIDLSGVPDGTYVLRAVADPLHVLTESDPTNNVTDTTLSLTGSTLTVLSQATPAVVPPTVAVTSPVSGATVSGTVALQATASVPTPGTVTSVQFLLDGQPLGSAVPTAPYGYSWQVGSTPPGTHTLSARATSSTGDVGTAPAITVVVQAPTGSGGLAVAQTVVRTGRGTTTTGAFSTGAAGAVLLALVGSDGPASAGTQRVTVSGAGLTWRQVSRANAQYGDSEVWTATAGSALSSATVTSTPAQTGYDQQLTLLVLTGASGVGAAAGASAASGAPSVSLSPTSLGSLSFASGNDWDASAARTVGPGQALLSQWLDSGTGDTFWAQGTSAVSSSTTVTLNDTAPTADRWNLAAAEVLPASSSPPPQDTTPPSVAISNPVSGQTVSGTQPVAVTASDDVAVASVQVLLDGQPLGAPVTAAPYAVAWDTTTATAGAHTLTATATDSSGNTSTSAAVPVVVQNPAPPMTCFVLQAQRGAHGRGSVTTTSFNTAVAGEVLLAFVSADGPARSAGQTAAVSGGGLTWRLVKRANAQYGDAEVWTATAPAVLSNVTVTSKLARSSYDQDLTVAAMEGSAGVGASVAGSAGSGAPGVTVTTTKATSLVLGVGNDWSRAVARTLPTGLVLLDQWLDTGAGDTFWSEYTNQTTGAAGTLVPLGATAPTNDRWNLVAVELLNSE
jgi:hypothetical protein